MDVISQRNIAKCLVHCPHIAPLQYHRQRSYDAYTVLLAGTCCERFSERLKHHLHRFQRTADCPDKRTCGKGFFKSFLNFLCCVCTKQQQISPGSGK